MDSAPEDRIHRWLLCHPGLHLHFTPVGALWLNLVERWFGMLTEKQIKRGNYRSTEDPTPFVWTKTADQIFESVARFCVANL